MLNPFTFSGYKTNKQTRKEDMLHSKSVRVPAGTNCSKSLQYEMLNKQNLKCYNLLSISSHAEMINSPW